MCLKFNSTAILPSPPLSLSATLTAARGAARARTSLKLSRSMLVNLRSPIGVDHIGPVVFVEPGRVFEALLVDVEYEFVLAFVQC